MACKTENTSYLVLYRKIFPTPNLEELTQQNLEIGVMERKGQRSHLDKYRLAKPGKCARWCDSRRTSFVGVGGKFD